jgi:hypothetical protein
MPFSKSKAMHGALAVALMLVSPYLVCAQRAVSLTLTVEDAANAVIPGASVQRTAGRLVGRTDANGRLTFGCELPCRIRVDAEGYTGSNFEISANTTVHLERTTVSEEITVTAYRTPLGELESPVTTRHSPRWR